jgi:hypothetical protein
MKKIIPTILILIISISTQAQFKRNIKRPYVKRAVINPVKVDSTKTTTTTISNIKVGAMDSKVYEPATNTYATPKGIIVVGSGNDENAPRVGDLNGVTENDLCKQAADNGYLAIVLSYSQGTSTWNDNAIKMGNDFDACIQQFASRYNIPAANSIVVGVSYTSFMLYTNIATSTTLSYCKGLIASCGSTDSWKAQNFKIPIYALNCTGNYEGDLNGQALYDAIPSSNPIKVLSEGFTDESCTGHCTGSWVTLMLNKIKTWIP